MKRGVRNTAAALLAGAVLLPSAGRAADDIQQRLDALSKEVQALKQKTAAQEKAQSKSLSNWLTIGGDYRFRFDSLRGKTADYYDFNDVLAWQFSPGVMDWIRAGGMASGTYPPVMPPSPREGDTVKNNSLYTNRVGLNLKAKVTQNVTFNTRLLMYKAYGSSNDEVTSGPYFADRVGVFDGTEGHVPNDGKIVVDQAYATWNNILDQGLWISLGRRPSTAGIPSHLRQNNERPGNGGIPSMMVDYAFDGAVVGWAPDIEALPGAYGKICYGRGYDSGWDGHGSRDTDFLGVSVVPVDIDPLYVNLQWQRGFHIFDFPVMDSNTALGGISTKPTKDLGDIDWFGITALSTLKKVGPGTLNVFASAALSRTRPTDNTLTLNYNGQTIDTGAGMMYANGDDHSVTGWGAYVGARYDFPTGTKIGAEYNHGSKNWISFTPAADDMWTSKLGTRGDVYELYVIQEILQKPLASYVAKAFFKVGYQYYDFKYTGSNNWVGEPLQISDLDGNMADAQMLTPVKHAQDIYATFEVKF